MGKRKWWALGIATAACGIVAALHLPCGRSLLAATGGCPVGKDGKPVSAERLEEFRVQAAKASLKGQGRAAAAARPAYGFTLDQSTKADVVAWATASAYDCKEELGGAALRCEGVGQREAAKPGGVRDAYFRFDRADSRGTIVGIDLMHEGATPERAAELLASLSAAVAREAGPPTAVRGEASAAHLGQGDMSRAATEFRFADYAADISATNFGDQGIVVRQQYRSVPNS
jgi:hypothetical protein